MTRTKKTTAPAKTKEIGLGFITELDRYLFGQGTHYKIFEKLGAHPKTYKGKAGMYFAVWAPHAKAVGSGIIVASHTGCVDFSKPLQIMTAVVL